MMQTCFTTLACPEWTLDQLLRSASALGFNGVELRGLHGELDLWQIAEFRGSELSRTHQRFRAAGLSVPCIGTSVCLHDQGAAVRLDDVARNCEIALVLGAQALRVFPDRLVEGRSRSETLQVFMESLARLRETAGTLEIWLETHGDFALFSQVEEVVDALGDSAPPLIWDPANAFAAAGEQPTLTQKLRTQLAHVHLKDMVRDGTGGVTNVLPGSGNFDVRSMLSQLRKASYAGYVSFEWEKRWHPELADAEIALPAFMQWWNETVRDARD